MLQLDVYDNLSDPTLDGVSIFFTAGGNNDVDTSDATKLWNPGVNIAIVNNSSYLIFELRDIPDDSTVIQLYSANFPTGDYFFRLSPNSFTGNVYLYDSFMNTYTDINTGSEVTETVSFDTSNSGSVNPFRFSIVFSNEVLPAVSGGLKIESTNSLYSVDFDTTTSNGNNGVFRGNGIQKHPATGALDSDAFIVSGLSSGSMLYGDNRTSGDYVRGASVGGVATGGVYAFEIATGDVALGFQATGTDLTPGSIQFRFQNLTGVTVTDLSIAYDLFHYNDEDGLGLITFSHGKEGAGLTSVSDFDNAIDDSDDGTPIWSKNGYVLNIPNLTLLDGESYILEWAYDSSGGSGVNDEFAIDNIQIIANPANVNTLIEGSYKDLVINGDVDVSNEVLLTGVLFLNEGMLNTGDALLFKSEQNSTAVIGPVKNGDISGDIIVEQFFPAKRAYRFISSSVDMTGTVFDNWQQTGINVGDMGYESGLGTHITGGISALGFDQSTSSNPSMFNFSNDVTQTWSAVANTNQTTLSAGDAYRLMIRGDRSISLSTSGVVANDTKFITQGTAVKGDKTQGFSSTLLTGDFVLVGNPYQSRVDIKPLLQDSAVEDINPNYMFVWNPQTGSNGAYVTYDLANNMAVPSDSQVDGVLQPGQSMFLQIDNDGDLQAPSIIFKEQFKTGDQTMLSTYSLPEASISLDVYNDVNDPAVDGVLALFNSSTGNDELNAYDAFKLTNIDENIAIMNTTNKLAIETSDMPQDGSIIPLHTSGFSVGTYTMKFKVNNIHGLNTYFYDSFYNIYTLLGNDSLTSLSVDFGSVSSMSPTRFSIVFSATTLGADDDYAFAKAMSLYPNPLNIEQVNIKGLEMGDVNVALFTLSGQLLSSYSREVIGASLSLTIDDTISNGVYILKVTQKNNSKSFKLIIDKP